MKKARRGPESAKRIWLMKYETIAILTVAVPLAMGAQASDVELDAQCRPAALAGADNVNDAYRSIGGGNVETGVARAQEARKSCVPEPYTAEQWERLGYDVAVPYGSYTDQELRRLASDDDGRAQVELGRRLLGEGKYDEAYEQLTRATVVHEYSVSLLHLAEYLEDQDQPVTALSLYKVGEMLGDPGMKRGGHLLKGFAGLDKADVRDAEAQAKELFDKLEAARVAEFGTRFSQS